MKADQLMVPVYINEKIVLDMLAIIEDGFSTVSQVSYTEHKENNNVQKLESGVSTSANILSKLLKIDLKGEVSHSGNSGENTSVAKEKVHTNVSLLSRFRTFLVNEKILKSGFDTANIKIGDFIENGIDSQPTIRPLLDLSDVTEGAGRLSALLSRNQAMKISAGMEREGGSVVQNGGTTPTSGNNYNFTQNNYSPKALSRIDIYRQTKNQFSALKGLVET